MSKNHKNYANILNDALNNKTHNLHFEDARIILKKLGYRDITNKLRRQTGRSGRSGGTYVKVHIYEHRALSDDETNKICLSPNANLSGDKLDEFKRKITKLVRVKPDILECLQPGYIARDDSNDWVASVSESGRSSGMSDRTTDM